MQHGGKDRTFQKIKQPNKNKIEVVPPRPVLLLDLLQKWPRNPWILAHPSSVCGNAMLGFDNSAVSLLSSHAHAFNLTFWREVFTVLCAPLTKPVPLTSPRRFFLLFTSSCSSDHNRSILAKYHLLSMKTSLISFSSVLLNHFKSHHKGLSFTSSLTMLTTEH